MKKKNINIAGSCKSGITLFLIALFISYPAFSQQEGIQIIYMRNLDFREMIPGVRKAVSETSPEAGKIIIRNYGGNCITGLSFNLSGGLSSGSELMPVQFSATYSTNANDNQPGIPFSPYSGTTLTFDDKTKEYYIRIGGAVNPPNIQKAGSYIAPVIIILTTFTN